MKNTTTAVSAILMVVALVSFLGLFAEWQNLKKENKIEPESLRQSTANRVIEHISYVQDPRTDPPACFAFYNYSSSSMAKMECASIPPELLTVAQITK